MNPKPASRECSRELPVADLTDAQLYSLGWIEESPLTFGRWFELADGSMALQTFTFGAELGQDQRPRIVYGPDR